MSPADYVPHSTGSLETLEQTFDLMHDDVGISVLIFMRIEWHKRTRAIHDFCLILKIETAGKTHDIERIDCCHSELHRHIFYRDRPESRKSIRELYPGDQVHLGNEFAAMYAELADNWREKFGRWKR